jgi:hypothetical protein
MPDNLANGIGVVLTPIGGGSGNSRRLGRLALLPTERADLDIELPFPPFISLHLFPSLFKIRRGILVRLNKVWAIFASCFEAALERLDHQEVN